MTKTNPAKSTKPAFPEHAKKVFSGIIFDVYQWEQELYDGSRTVFEKLKRPGTVMAICIAKNGQIVLLKQSQPGKDEFLGLVGGRVEQGEEPVQAIAREVLEETGMQGTAPELLLELNPFGKIDWTISTYIIRNCEKITAPNLDGGELIEVRFVDWETFVETVIFDDKYHDQEISLMFARAKLLGKLPELRRQIIGD